MSRKSVKYEKRKEGYRVPELGYYCIVVDTKETEPNYFNGLKESIHLKNKGSIVIKIKKDVSTNDLVDEALLFAHDLSQYSIPYIVLDKDKIENFDEIINKALNNGVYTAWSNPCFEVWLLSYFGEKFNSPQSVKCCEMMNKIYKEKVGVEYNKNSKDLYKKLLRYGDEKNAIDMSKEKHLSAINNYCKPSEMVGCNTVYALVEEILNKAE